MTFCRTILNTTSIPHLHYCGLRTIRTLPTGCYRSQPVTSIMASLMSPREMDSTSTRITKEGRKLTYQLSVIQQPERARACGSGAKCEPRSVQTEVIIANRHQLLLIVDRSILHQLSSCAYSRAMRRTTSPSRTMPTSSYMLRWRSRDRWRMHVASRQIRRSPS